MEPSHILGFIKELTTQKNKDDLIQSFIKVFELTFLNSRVRVFELCRIRIKGDRKNHLVAINTQDYDHSIEIDDKEDPLNRCISDRKSVALDQISNNITTHIYPIFSIKKVIYITEIEMSVFDDSTKAFIEQLIVIFNDLVNLLHSKDHDPLTGLLNRMAYNDLMNVIEVEPEKHISYASDQKPFTAIGILDIDFFKRVNDNFGHLIGDEVLLIFSQIIKTVFRHNDLLFRYGGGEVVVILKDVDPGQAGKVFERCRHEIEKHEFPKVEHVTASIGFAIIDEYISPHIIVDRADMALYYAKENGRNRVCCYDGLVKSGSLKSIEPKEKLIDLSKV